MADNDKEDQEKPSRPVIRFEKRNMDLDIQLGHPGSNMKKGRVNASMSPEELARMLEKLKNGEKPDDI